ncbi:uncharacterized protein B0H64DRAFT_420639 [Chaetomium fimeti]|uniref:Rhodopsin domain-containing protein n=1 Tax=Chaetomium fimeti TaxID=1854472 RepID=A0AAE0LMQ6_9PEZI|nr:hypothetical protein B0H64DRAFT_420639 [Chaetomium fimeti]
MGNVDYGPQLNVLTWLLISISGLFLFTRLYLKHCQHRGLWWDDWILLASWVALAASASLVAFLVSIDYGKRFIPFHNAIKFGLPVNVLSTLVIIANLWGKTSFAVTLLRLPVRWMRISVWYILTTLTLTLTASVLMVWIECGPFKLAGDCVPVGVSIRYNVFSCAYSAAVDVALAVLPWKYLVSQQMSKKEKTGAMVAMSMGIFAGATAAAKASTIPQLQGSTDARGSIPLVALSLAEAAVCIVAASIPILRALSRGGFRGPVHFGYQTGYGTAMVESERQGVTSLRSQTTFVSLPIQGSRRPQSGQLETGIGIQQQQQRRGTSLWNDPDKSYAYICWCQPPFPVDNDDNDDDDDDDDDKDDEEEGEDGCDGGKTCLCGKPAQEHPDHKWITMLTWPDFATPGNFDMHTFSDHAAYGVVEVIENLLLDFVEANGNWREQWVVIDDPDTVNHLIRLVGRTFLAMLAQLERQRRLGPDSEVKDLGLIMSLYIETARTMQVNDLLKDGDEETVELKMPDGSTEKYTFDLGKLDEYILGYVERHSISVPDAPQDGEGAAEELPPQTSEDPWNTAEAFRRYERVHGKASGPGEKPAIGGDRYDITTWTSAERRSASFKKRDPFSKKEIAALKLGFMLGFE